jgi:hypothetical protein
MDELYLHLKENSCTLQAGDKLLWSANRNFADRRGELFKELRKNQRPLTLILDEFWIKKIRIHLEDVAPEDEDGILRTQAAYLLNIPPEMIVHALTDVQRSPGKLQGALYCTDKKAITDLAKLFLKNGIDLVAIQAQELPEYLWFDKKVHRKQQEKTAKKTLAIAFPLLLLILGLNLLHIYLNELIARYYPQEQLYLSALKENQVLRGKKANSALLAQLKVQAEQQKKVLGACLSSLPRACRPDILPQKLSLDLQNKELVITGTAKSPGSATQFIERLHKYSLPSAALTTLENSSTIYIFTIKALL